MCIALLRGDRFGLEAWRSSTRRGWTVTRMLTCCCTRFVMPCSGRSARAISAAIFLPAILSIDATLIAEAPKILPHVPSMKIAVAQALHISPDQIGIKATTNELLGFLGREEGMAAMAVAAVNFPQ